MIHRFEPASNPAEPRTLLLLHGTGGNENDLLPLAPILLPGAAALSPRGTVLERGQPRFFRRLAEGVFDEEDLVKRTHEMADFIAESAEHYGFDPSRVIAAGYSNGANLAATMLLLRPTALAGAVLFRAMQPLDPPVLPDLDGVPVFLGEGRSDPYSATADALAALLRSAGARVELAWRDAGHELTPEDVDAAHEWLVRERVALPTA